MRKLLCLWPLLLVLVMPAAALEIEAPPVPESGAEVMQEEYDSFGAGLIDLAKKAILFLEPNIKTAAGLLVCILSAVILLSVVKVCSGTENHALRLTSTATISILLLNESHTLVHLAAQTIQEVSDYGKLLLPVMATGMAAQGGVTASASLYTGTAVFTMLLSELLSNLFVPAVFLLLAMAIGYSATGETLLKRIRDAIKSVVSWSLKTLLMVFTTYMSITGVVSGTADASALKATKVTISTVVPVVGGILSEASDAVLISAGLLKSAAGIYGILAILAICLEPFVRIGVQYLMLKAAAVLCGILGEESAGNLTEDFSSAMGLLLAMTGSVCLLLLIGIVCFMKGVGG